MAGPTHVFVLNDAGAEIARKFVPAMSGVLIGLKGRVSVADHLVNTIGDAIREAFSAGKPVIGVMASGAMIRILAPLLTDKQNEPPVLVISEDGQSVVPLLGGHHGANDLARAIAEILEAHAAVTTAGDLRFGIALDQPPKGYVLANPENAKPVMAALLAGDSAQLVGDCEWLSASTIPFSDKGKVRLIVGEKVHTPGPLDLHYVPRTLVLGMGCERHASGEEALALAISVLERSGLSAKALAALASIDVKMDETALHHVAEHFGIPAVFYPAERLGAGNRTPGKPFGHCLRGSRLSRCSRRSGACCSGSGWKPAGSQTKIETCNGCHRAVQRTLE